MSHTNPKDWTQCIPSLNLNHIYAHVFPVNNGYKKKKLRSYSLNLKLNGKRPSIDCLLSSATPVDQEKFVYIPKTCTEVLLSQNVQYNLRALPDIYEQRLQLARIWPHGDTWFQCHLWERWCTTTTNRMSALSTVLRRYSDNPWE